MGPLWKAQSQLLVTPKRSRKSHRKKFGGPRVLAGPEQRREEIELQAWRRGRGGAAPPGCVPPTFLRTPQACNRRQVRRGALLPPAGSGVQRKVPSHLPVGQTPGPLGGRPARRPAGFAGLPAPRWQSCCAVLCCALLLAPSGSSAEQPAPRPGPLPGGGAGQGEGGGEGGDNQSGVLKPGPRASGPAALRYSVYAESARAARRSPRAGARRAGSGPGGREPSPSRRGGPPRTREEHPAVGGGPTRRTSGRELLPRSRTRGHHFWGSDSSREGQAGAGGGAKVQRDWARARALLPSPPAVGPRAACLTSLSQG